MRKRTESERKKTEAELLKELEDHVVTARSVVEAFEDVPIVYRLQFVKMIVLGRGGEMASVPNDPALIVAAQMLDRIIDMMERHPAMAKFGRPEPC